MPGEELDAYVCSAWWTGLTCFVVEEKASGMGVEGGGKGVHTHRCTQ